MRAVIPTQADIGTGFTRVSADGDATAIKRELAVEMPVAIEYDGIGYAVLMATPADLTDLAYGFSLAERLISTVDDIVEVDEHHGPAGVILRIFLKDTQKQQVFERVRHRVSDSACGICGIENLEQAMRSLPAVVAQSDAPPQAIFRALELLVEHQPLNRRTGAAHAAALCGANGDIRLAREDVGRHNAFDKLIGAMLRQGLCWDRGFALLSSRCSYELVEKAVLAGCPLLATISAPTSLAASRAREAGLKLAVLARRDALLLSAP